MNPTFASTAALHRQRAFVNRLTARFLPEGSSPEAHRSNEQYARILIYAFLVMGFIIPINLLQHNWIHAVLDLSLTLMIPIYLWILKKNYSLLSKSMMAMHTMLVIATESMVFQNQSYILALCFPFAISMYLSFRGEEKNIGTALIVILVIITALLAGDPPAFYIVPLNPDQLYSERFLNLGAAMALLILAARHMIQNSEKAEHAMEFHAQQMEENNRRLENANHTKTRLFSVIGHDLRNPLIAIKSSVSLLNDPGFPEDQRQVLITELDKRVDVAMHLMNNLLMWSKTQLNGITFQPEMLIPSDLCKAAMREVETLAANKNITLSLQSSLPAHVFADRNMLDIVLRNLLTNSIKFTMPGGFIRISVETQDGQKVITISDSGLGMTPEVLEKIRRQEFYTTHGTSREKGSGLGLMLCREFLGRHNAELQIESSPGKGTRTSFALNIVEE
jgi:signal transduction histidine kinase